MGKVLYVIQTSKSWWDGVFHSYFCGFADDWFQPVNFLSYVFWIQVFIVCKYNDIILYRGFALLLKETYIGNHRFVDQKFSFKRNWFDYLFCVFLISKMLCICQFSPSSSQRLFWNIGGFRTKKYSADHWTGNIYYSVIFRYKRYFSDQVVAMMNSPGTAFCMRLFICVSLK